MTINLTDQQSVPAASASLAVAALTGIIVGSLVGMVISWKLAPLVSWDVAAAIYMTTTWRRVLHLDSRLIKKHALREDPSRVTADLVLISASIASLGGVGLVLTHSDANGLNVIGAAALGLVSVVISWCTIHTVYALRYAELYYRHSKPPIDFNDTTTPDYVDFAYLAFTLGMTFQVSDTALKSRSFRELAFRHALLSYAFGTIIIAATINLIAGLSK